MKASLFEKTFDIECEKCTSKNPDVTILWKHYKIYITYCEPEYIKEKHHYEVYVINTISGKEYDYNIANTQQEAVDYAFEEILYDIKDKMEQKKIIDKELNSLKEFI